MPIATLQDNNTEMSSGLPNKLVKPTVMYSGMKLTNNAKIPRRMLRARKNNVSEIENTASAMSPKKISDIEESIYA